MLNLTVPPTENPGTYTRKALTLFLNNTVKK